MKGKWIIALCAVVAVAVVAFWYLQPSDDRADLSTYLPRFDAESHGLELMENRPRTYAQQHFSTYEMTLNPGQAGPMAFNTVNDTRPTEVYGAMYSRVEDRDQFFYAFAMRFASTPQAEQFMIDRQACGPGNEWRPLLWQGDVVVLLVGASMTGQSDPRLQAVVDEARSDLMARLGVADWCA